MRNYFVIIDRQEGIKKRGSEKVNCHSNQWNDTDTKGNSYSTQNEPFLRDMFPFLYIVYIFTKPFDFTG